MNRALFIHLHCLLLMQAVAHAATDIPAVPIDQGGSAIVRSVHAVSRPGGSADVWGIVERRKPSASVGLSSRLLGGHVDVTAYDARGHALAFRSVPLRREPEGRPARRTRSRYWAVLPHSTEIARVTAVFHRGPASDCHRHH